MRKDEVEEFRNWHEKRLAELNYPPAIVDKLRSDREHWLAGPAKKKK